MKIAKNEPEARLRNHVKIHVYVERMFSYHIYIYSLFYYTGIVLTKKELNLTFSM